MNFKILDVPTTSISEVKKSQPLYLKKLRKKTLLSTFLIVEMLRVLC